MIDAGVNEGDILVIDKSLEPRSGDMAVCFIDGEFTLKYLQFDAGKASRKTTVRLVPANERYPVIEVGEGSDFIIWGIVTYVIKKVR